MQENKRFFFSFVCFVLLKCSIAMVHLLLLLLFSQAVNSSTILRPVGRRCAFRPVNFVRCRTATSASASTSTPTTGGRLASATSTTTFPSTAGSLQRHQRVQEKESQTGREERGGGRIQLLLRLPSRGHAKQLSPDVLAS